MYKTWVGQCEGNESQRYYMLKIKEDQPLVYKTV